MGCTSSKINFEKGENLSSLRVYDSAVLWLHKNNIETKPPISGIFPHWEIAVWIITGPEWQCIWSWCVNPVTLTIFEKSKIKELLSHSSCSHSSFGGWRLSFSWTAWFLWSAGFGDYTWGCWCWALCVKPDMGWGNGGRYLPASLSRLGLGPGNGNRSTTVGMTNKPWKYSNPSVLIRWAL